MQERCTCNAGDYYNPVVVTIVSADDYWKGDPPKTSNGISGVVNGGVDVLFADTWSTMDNPVCDSAWANFTLRVDPAINNIKFARLYVTVWTGNMTTNNRGYETIALYRNGLNPEILTEEQPLELDYDRTEGPSYIDIYDYTTYYIQNISRVTSEYYTILDNHGPDHQSKPECID